MSFVTCPAHTIVMWLNQDSKLVLSTPKPVLLPLTLSLAETSGKVWVSGPLPSFPGPALWKRSLSHCAYLFCFYLNEFLFIFRSQAESPSRYVSSCKGGQLSPKPFAFLMTSSFLQTENSVLSHQSDWLVVNQCSYPIMT